MESAPLDYCWQVPFTQKSNFGQALPQPPQLLVLVNTSTQTPLHELVPGPQMRLPPWQIAPCPQDLPQPPQLLGSTLVSMHRLPHDAWPCGQPHVPPLQS